MIAEALVAAVFTVAMGFVAAGISASGYRLVTDARLDFAAPSGSLATRARRILVIAVAGPLILVVDAWQAAAAGLQPVSRLFASALVASAWSFCIGVAVINVLVMIGTAGG